jgi:trehalose 2-sulfotransferase
MRFPERPDVEMRGYAICGERRSGSNFLCSLLASTGVLGIPTEYFSVEAMRHRGIADYPADPEGQVQSILRLGATPNGIYGVKLHSVEFDAVKGTRWAERLPSLSFVCLDRLDVLGQAISWVRASQTDQWTSFLSPEGQPTYDRDRINNAMSRILNGQARWRYYLARNGLPVLHFTYEGVASAPQETVDAIARLMGLTEKPRIDFSKVRFEMQRDALNDEWRKRFLAESRDLSLFH